MASVLIPRSGLKRCLVFPTKVVESLKNIMEIGGWRCFTPVPRRARYLAVCPGCLEHITLVFPDWFLDIKGHCTWVLLSSYSNKSRSSQMLSSIFRSLHVSGNDVDRGMSARWSGTFLHSVRIYCSVSFASVYPLHRGLSVAPMVNKYLFRGRTYSLGSQSGISSLSPLSWGVEDLYTKHVLALEVSFLDCQTNPLELIVIHNPKRNHLIQNLETSHLPACESSSEH